MSFRDLRAICVKMTRDFWAFLSFNRLWWSQVGSDHFMMFYKNVKHSKNLLLVKTRLSLIEFWWLEVVFGDFRGTIFKVFRLWQARTSSDYIKMYKTKIQQNKTSLQPQTEIKNIQFWIFQRNFSETLNFHGGCLWGLISQKSRMNEL